MVTVLSSIPPEDHTPVESHCVQVVLTGNKIGQHFDGGYAEFCRVQAGSGFFVIP